MNLWHHFRKQSLKFRLLTVLLLTGITGYYSSNALKAVLDLPYRDKAQFGTQGNAH